MKLQADRLHTAPQGWQTTQLLYGTWKNEGSTFGHCTTTMVRAEIQNDTQYMAITVIHSSSPILCLVFVSDG